MVSERMQKVAPSATNVLAARIADMREQGMEIMSFNVGEPDFDTPKKIVDAALKAMQDGHTKYAPVSGILALRKAICEKLEKDNEIHYEPSQICVTTGAKQAILNTLLAIVNPGDEVIVPVPCWVSYFEMIKLAQGIPVPVKCRDDNQLDLEAIEAAVTDKTKMIIINTPNNPTGACYPKEDLMKMGELAVKYDFYIVADEVYEKLVYDKEHVSVASLSDEIREHTITVNGCSKAFAMTGWRLGYTAAPSDVAKAITTMQSNITGNSTSFVQHAAVTALKECDDEVEAMRVEFCKRRDFAYDRMSSIEGISCTKPEGAFYLLPDVTSFFGKTGNGNEIKNSSDLCEYLLEEAKIALVPGEAFSAPGKIRFAYPASMEEIVEGLNRFEAALKKLI